MQEPAGWDDEAGPLPPFDEGLGELPWSYGDDALVALPRDPRSLFVYWDHRHDTLAGAFSGLDHPSAQLWLYALGDGWERVRVVELALESRCHYLHDLEPGRAYRAKLRAVGRGGEVRPVGEPSNVAALPGLGPSPVIDDLFVGIPWGLPLPLLLGPGRRRGPFPEDARALLARLSAWAQERPGSPAPTSPSGPYGARGP
jgi:hypothetical protein